MSDYTNIERTLLQSFIARRTFTNSEAIACIDKIRQVESQDVGNDTEEDLQNTINKINRAIEPFGLNIIKTRDETSSNTFHYTLVNRLANKIAQLATALSANEIDFFKVLLDQIFVGEQHTPEKDQFWIPFTSLSKCAKIQAARVAADQQRAAEQEEETEEDGRRIATVFKKPLIESEYKLLLEILCEESWVLVTVSGNSRSIYPSPRLLAELRPYLIERYGDGSNEELSIPASNHLRFCLACKNVFTRGIQCQTAGCATRLHKACEDAFYRHNGGSSCPNCSSDLKESGIVV